MLELKNNKHNTYYRCTYLYIVNAVIFKLLLTYYLKCDTHMKNMKGQTDYAKIHVDRPVEFYRVM